MSKGLKSWMRSRLSGFVKGPENSCDKVYALFALSVYEIRVSQREQNQRQWLPSTGIRLVRRFKDLISISLFGGKFQVRPTVRLIGYDN